MCDDGGRVSGQRDWKAGSFQHRSWKDSIIRRDLGSISTLNGFNNSFVKWFNSTDNSAKSHDMMKDFDVSSKETQKIKEIKETGGTTTKKKVSKEHIQT